ncbi:sterol glucosyltransferase [Mycena capillaripes]|nr:sterol glucosyltransferase [Mycena capillaripes]
MIIDQVMDVQDDAPPPYQVAEIVHNTVVREDGRIDVDLDSKLGRTLSILVPRPPRYLPDLPVYTEPRDWNIKLNIVIQVVGSRGDVQPFIALANALQKHGHRVRLATHYAFEEFVKQSGLEFYPIGGDPAELMAYMVKNPGLIPSMKSLRAGDIQRKRAMIAEILEGCWRSCVEPDMLSDAPFVAEAIIANPPSFAHVHCAQALGIPVHLMFTMPWTSTRAFSHPLANLKYSKTDPGIANYISYGVVEFLTWQGLGDVINKWRYSIDLEPVPISEGPSLVDTLRVPFTYCWSPTLVPKPADWAVHIDVCGFVFRDSPSYTPPPDLDAFIRAGPPPVYIGFGSIVIDDPQQMNTILLDAIQVTGVRAIISSGWSKLDGPPLPNVLYIGDCPHEWLFQHVSAVVHHGGAGTTACGLLNGRPTTIVPFFGDQPFWGNIVAGSGAGPEPIPHRVLNADNLAEAINFCLSTEASVAAQTIADKMRAEQSGVEAAVASFHANLPSKPLQCDIFIDRPATWVLKKGKRKIQLSKLAAEVLVQDMGTNRKALKVLDASRISMENRRWDPVTGTSSALIGSAANMVDATADILVKPYQELRRAGKNTGPQPYPKTFDQDSNSEFSVGSSRGTQSLRKGIQTAGAMAAASGKSVGQVFTSGTRGLIVDIPLAAAEGLRSVPKLYGEELKDYGRVDDWRSGAVVAGRTFIHGMADGVSGLVMDPYRGAREEGIVGIAKGIGKGTLGFFTKTSSATLGLVAYPGQGIYKSIRAASHGKTLKQIIAARHAEGEWLAGNVRSSERQRVISAYAELLGDM